MSEVSDNSVELSIRNVSKTFTAKDINVQAIKNITFNIYKGEFISLLGPSGCGKTTLLRLIAGLERQYQGEIFLEGKRIEGPGLDRGIIYQEHRLLPWLTVGDNVGLGLEGPKSYITEQVMYYLEKVGLKGFENAYPKQLSGGMSQRAAIARALICRPKIFLLDEPFGSLDALTRVQMQDIIEKIYLNEKVTMVFVTHDIEEAIFLSDRIVIITPRPAEINTVIPITLKRSRERNSDEFIEVRKNIVNIFNANVGTYTI